MTEYKNKRRLGFIWLISNPIADSKEAVKESFELINHSLLFLGSGTATATAKSGHRRHQFIDIRSGGLDLAIPEGIFQKLAGFRFAKFFVSDDLRQFFLSLLCHKTMPLFQYILHIVDAGNKVFDELLFAAQFGTCVYSFLDGNKDLFIITMGIMIFFTNIRM